MKQPLKSQTPNDVIDWTPIRRVLLIRLRSIGDTVLMTPCLTVLKQFRPDLHVAVLLEKLSAPLLKKDPQVDEVILLDRTANQWHNGARRWKLVQRLRQAQFDIAFNMHGGTTATFLCYLSRARYGVGYQGYRYSFLHSHRAPDPEAIWQKSEIHSVEQQMGLLKWVGVPIEKIPPTSLHASEAACEHATRRLSRAGISQPFALIHPGATAGDKCWPVEKFARVVEYLSARYQLPSLVVGTRQEAHRLGQLKDLVGNSIVSVTDLHLKELIALCTMARIFVGNDSGPAHIAVTQRCPTVVIFGASDHRVWRPWGDIPHAVVRVETDGAGRHLEPAERINHVPVGPVIEAIDRLLKNMSQPSVINHEPSVMNEGVEANGI